jgi:parallel beta-helix repeat protein
MTKRILSAIMMSLLVLGTSALVFKIQPVNADGVTIFINADGSITPPTAPIHTADNITYTLTGNITANADGIVIERDSIVLNGAGYTVQGPDVVESKGISLDGRSNVTIKNTTIEAFYYCIWLNYSSNNSISENNITTSSYRGIYLDSSSSNNISGNNITNNGEGIVLDSSSSNSISGNKITNNDFISIWLDSSSNNNISGNNITNNGEGIVLHSSSSNSISGNNITHEGSGISLSSSSSNGISGNNITNNVNGIWLTFCSSSSIFGNNITNNGKGIWLDSSSNNNIFGNSMTANYAGIWLRLSSSSSIFGNNITNNVNGIYLESSSSNSIFHNTFVNNTNQVSTDGLANIWDNGYPSGGNYWSDYNGTDLKSGQYQNETGSDGIGDTPYGIDTNNTDHYPLMKPWYHILGDINYDGKVDLQDLQLLTKAYKSKPGDSNWNPLADIAPPYGIISLTDLVTLAMHYGQHNP